MADIPDNTSIFLQVPIQQRLQKRGFVFVEWHLCHAFCRLSVLSSAHESLLHSADDVSGEDDTITFV